MSASRIVQVTGEVLSAPSDLVRDLPSGPWTVMHVKPRQDLKAFHDARAQGLPVLLFAQLRVRRYPGKGVQRSRVPLLPGYVFCAVGPESHQRLYDGGRVVRLLSPRDPAQFQREVADLARLLVEPEAHPVLEPHLVPGMEVTVTKGTFAGCRGVIQRRDGYEILAVNLHLLGHAVVVRMPADQARADT